ncbi:GDP-mannose 4,6-dehydratase [Paenibacillus sediminis]|uniref:UDP-glucose 4-epimerase n=1 Tax=Paenibacillus sediminis TaxID=664909 RepID=A0ABS4H3A9_9BACL|nr:GDP-mannose 4,6-dehydratase [Paenibacillus sediminis]MBP1937009.1 UDP-glucose 4-epimerase [Paenibacillus sediminis]
MKAVVTGGTGFIGSHLVDKLVARGFEVHVIDNLTSGYRHNINFQSVIHYEDIRNKESKEIIVREKPDVVFHLAAQTDVGQSIRDPRHDSDVNITGTINILKACRQASVKKIIFASTSAVYGDLQKNVISEEDPKGPISFYGLSKWTSETYIRLFYEMYGLSYTILRYGNVYGPRQTPKGEGGAVAVFLDKIKNELPIHVHGDGQQTRDFVYVDDVVQANIAAIERGHQEAIHVATGQRTSINDLVKMLTNIHGPIDIIHSSERAGDIRHSCLDNSKAHLLLDWQPQVDIQTGLLRTYNET